MLMDAHLLQCVHGNTNWRVGHAERYTSRHSVRPSTFAPVLVRASGAPGAGYELAMMKWGLVPSWAKPDDRNRVPLLTNARSETVIELPSFAGALKRKVSRRCVVPSTGFYEWEAGPTKSSRKTPFLIRLGTPKESRDVLLMAGIYDIWNPPDGGEELHTFTICTTDTNEQFEWLHHRLPCILETEEDVNDWLDVGVLPGPDAVKKVLRTTKCVLVWTQMSSDLQNEVGNPSSKRTKPDIKSFFKKNDKGAKKKEEVFPVKSLAEKAASSGVKRELQSPIAKTRSSANRGEALGTPKKKGKKPTPKPSPKRSADSKQKSITSFFRKPN